MYVQYVHGHQRSNFPSPLPRQMLFELIKCLLKWLARLHEALHVNTIPKSNEIFYFSLDCTSANSSRTAVLCGPVPIS